MYAFDFSSISPSRQLHLLVQAITGYAIYILDADGYVRSANPGAEQVEGYTEDCILGRHFSVFFIEEDRSIGKPAEALAMAHATGRYTGYGWSLRGDQTRFWASFVLEAIYNDHHVFVGYARIVKDSTEHRGSGNEFRHTDRDLRLFMESVVHQAMFALDTNGLVTSWNPGAQRAKGYARGEILGQHFSIFFTKEDQALGKPEKAMEIACTTGRFEAEGWRMRKDGTRFWASVVMQPIRDEQGLLVGYAKITRDITERLALEAVKDELLQAQQIARGRAELRLQEMETELFHIQRFTALGEMASTLAHELNQPLAAISNYLKGSVRFLDKMSGEHVDALRTAVEEAANQALRAGDIIRHIRQFLARGEVDRRPEILSKLLEEAVSLALIGLPKNHVEVSFDLAEPAREVMVDRVQVQQVLLNLIRNANEAMQDCSHRKLICKISGVTDKGMVQISVSDTGSGLAPHVEQKLFQAFISTKGTGMGIGLSICRTIVEAHGGRIWVESTPNQGTTFCFTLRTY